MPPNIANRTFVKVCAAAIALTFASFTPAKAAMTIFSASVFDQSGAVTNANAAVGRLDGVGAIVGNGGALTLQFRHPLTGSGLTIDLLPTAGMNVLVVSVGEIIGGVATFSAGSVTLLDTGAGGPFGLDLTTLCATVSATGCSLVRLENFVAIGSPGFALDGVSGVTNAPEPSVWTLMILGFGVLAWRLKKHRTEGAIRGAAIGFSPANQIACA